MKNLSRSVLLNTGRALLLMVSMSVSGIQAQELPNEVVINDVELVLVPEGWFFKTGGVRPEGDDSPYNIDTGGGNAKIWIDSFYIAKYEARATDLVNLLNSSDGDGFNYDGGEENCAIRQASSGRFYRINETQDLPATHLSWDQANRFAQWKGMRLPSEAEWEKAARGLDQRIYPWGNDYPDETYANFSVKSGCFTLPVDSYKKGVSPYGLYNMAGNIYEYTADWYSQEYDEALKDGLRNPEAASQSSTQNNREFANRKVLKGGRWASLEDELRISNRYTYPPQQAFRCFGTRFALDASTVIKHLEQGTATITRN